MTGVVLKALLSGLLTLLLGLPSWALAGDVHHNQMDIQRGGENRLDFSLSLNLTQVLHQVLAPQVPLLDFLQSCAQMPDKDFQAAMAKAAAQLGEKSFLWLPSGVKVPIRSWQLPPLPALREAIKAHAFLMEMPSTTPVHVPPMGVKAIGQSKSPVARAQLQMHKALHPLWVSQRQDQFWLTDQIPMAVVNFE